MKIRKSGVYQERERNKSYTRKDKLGKINSDDHVTTGSIEIVGVIRNCKNCQIFNPERYRKDFVENDNVR